MADVDTCYISCGCNRTPHCADWGRNNLICYGSRSAVIIGQPELSDKYPAAIKQTLIGHTAKVNCVKWIPPVNTGDERELVSGSVDKSVILWEKHDQTYKVKQTLKGHEGPVTALDILNVPSCEEPSLQGTPLCRSVLVTSSVDSTVKVWRRTGNSEFTENQTFKYGTGFALDMSLIQIPNTDLLLLACACDDMKVHIYAEHFAGEQLQFAPVITLPGHEDWVRAVSFSTDDTGDILLASAAQDYLIRVWRFSLRAEDTGKKIDSIVDLPLEKDIQMRETTFTFTYKESPIVYAVSLETVLSGHENWIYCVKWKPKTLTDGRYHQEMCLLSVSMDKTMILWQPDTQSGVWTEQVRVGEVGGNTLGLYGGMFSADGQSILTHGYQGAFHHWTCNQELNSWEHVVTVSGHFDSVEDIAWDIKGGNFLISGSLDETVRLHAPWCCRHRQVLWYEIARPQIHGYAIQCLTMVNRYQYASGADEKVVRVFDAPDNFIENLCNLCALDRQKERSSKEAKNRPVGASVPALGLSNKAIFTDAKVDMTEDLKIKPGDNEQYADNVFTQVALKAPPSEEHLLQNTLWPEVQKLYGHGYEVFSLASDPQGTVIASSCKASKAEFAGVILWDPVTWQQLGSLDGPTLTVTQIAFSHSGRYLLTVSRDRTWFLYARRAADRPITEPLYSLALNTDKKTSVHSRIIWSCAWSHDDNYFITASRDKKVVIWHCASDQVTEPKLAGKLETPDSATAVDASPVGLSDSSYLIAVGLDNGQILLYKWLPSSESPWKQLAVLDNNIAHHMTVKRLKFRPCLGLAGIHGDDLEKSSAEVKDVGPASDWLQLASCSADHSVKIYNIHLKMLN